MDALIGCETSGAIREALRRRGIDAWSCDKRPADDNSPFHFQCDIRGLLPHVRPRLFIVHPDCTYMTVSGLHWNARGRMVDGRPRAELTDEAVAFAMQMFDQPHIEFIGMENPIGCLSTRFRKPDQIIQPYQFGDDASKATCLWLKGLPLLRPTRYFPPRLVCVDCGGVFAYGLHKCPACNSERYRPRWGNQTNSGQNKLGPSEDRWKIRSATYPGIADAVGEQWSKVLK